MKTVITAEFTGYPGAPDDQTERRFRVGEEPAETEIPAPRTKRAPR